jgi:hypothetical protein
MVRARKKKKATINRINRLILKIILPTTNTNKKHITTSIYYDKNENFCFSRKIISSFSLRRLWKEKKAKNTSRFRLLNTRKNSSASYYVCVSKRWKFWNSTFFPKVFPPSPTRKKNERLKKKNVTKKNREKKQKNSCF